MVDRPAQAVTADALPTLQLDNSNGKSIVWTQTISGSVVYAGGTFTGVKAAGSTAVVARGNLVAYDITTGNLVTTFAPSLDNTVKSLAVSPDGKRLYVGGVFTKADGQTRNRIAAYDLTSGNLVATFAPSLNATVTGIVATDTTVYVSGFFNSANGSNRTRLAAFRATDGALTTWAPTADYDINAMVMTPDKANIVIGGGFQNVNGSPAQGIAAISAATGSSVSWPVNQIIHNGNAQSGIYSLSTDSDTIYGTNYNYGTGNYEGEFAMRQDGTIKWLADCHGDTYAAFSADNGVVYGAGHPHFCSNIGGYPESNPRKEQRLVAFTREATGTVAANGQGGSGYGNFEGQPSPSLMNYFPQFAAGGASGSSQAVWSLTGNKQYLAAGGEFPSVNGKAQYGLVRFAVPSIAPRKVGPTDLGGTTNPTVTPIDGYGARVSWKLNWDYDDTTLTYKVVRADKTSTPLYTTSLPSYFWQRPLTTFVDKTAEPGKTYRYRILTSDPDGNSTQSDYVSVTMPTTTLSAYAKAVLDDGAQNYWRFNDGNQSTLADLSGGNTMSKQAGVSAASDGALSGEGSITTDGSSSGVAGATTGGTAPDTFSAEAWIKTTTTNGGKIFGFGDTPTGTSSGYDRHVYMDNAGHLTFGVYPGSLRTLTTDASFNDGKWHHIVAELSSAGMSLYVDGIQEGNDPGTTGGQPYGGYWRVGGDNLNGWTNRGSSDDFAGQIDDFAVYPTALSVTQVRDHYTKSGRTVDLPSQPSDAYGQTVYADNPTLYWRLDDAAGPTVKDSGPKRQSGLVSGGVTFGTPSGVSGSTGSAATFDGNDGTTIGSSKVYSNPTVYSEELWFSTTTNQGGKLIGFGSYQSGRSNHYDRHVYMEDSGQLTFGTYSGQLNLITSPRSYNDGAFHHMVATQSADGMKLYVDGVLVGVNGQTGAEPYDGYWRVGGDSDWGGTSAFFAGTIDEAAVYPIALTAAQVRAHYVASPAATNAAPVAAFSVDACPDGVCSFDGSGSNDPDGTVAAYDWDFGDRSTASGASPVHTYASPGTYTVALTVTDDRGKKTTLSKDVQVAINKAPTAVFTSTCDERVCSFDGSGSSDSDGSIATYAWSFSDGASSDQASPSHTFSADGTFAVTLTVTDNQGKTNQLTKQVVAKANVAPTAAFSPTCTALACNVDASDSQDPDGTIASYAWDFGDTGTAVGRTASHTYTKAGTYAVKLTVTDNKGAVGTVAKNVTVAPANVKPSAAFTPTCTDLTCAADASASTDSDGSVASYAWDFGDNATATGRTASHSYARSGTYSIKLTVTDDRGATDSVTRSVSVAAPNMKPTAVFAQTCTTLSCGFDASASADSDGTIAGYAWDFGDGKSGTGKTVDHAYSQAGSYSVKLTVTDDQGATDAKTATVTISSAPAQLASDQFNRSGTGWGSADTGGAWTVSSSSIFSTTGSTGVTRLAAAGSSGTAYLSSTSASDVTVKTDLSVDKAPTGSGTYVNLLSRRNGSSFYSLKVRLMADGTVHLAGARTTSGTETTFSEVVVKNLTYTPGTVLRASFVVSGGSSTVLTGKVWVASGSEPSSTQYSYSDSSTPLTAAGSVGLYYYLGGTTTNAPVVATVDNFSATKP